MDRDEDTDLSFAYLVQQPNVPNKPRPKQLSASPSFKFWQASRTPPSPSPADLSFANGTISPQSPVLVDRQGSRSMKRCLRQENGWRSADSAPKRVSFQEPVPTPRRSTSSPLPERARSFGEVGARPEVKGKRDAESSKGLLGSIIMACRDCRAVEPSKRVGNLAN